MARVYLTRRTERVPQKQQLPVLSQLAAASQNANSLPAVVEPGSFQQCLRELSQRKIEYSTGRATITP
jgi:hypothetical protein